MGKRRAFLPRAVEWNPQYSDEDLSPLWRIPLNNETDPSKLIVALRERIKELNCLYMVAQLAERHPDSIDNLLRELVQYLPLSWQYPQITCARITFKKETYRSQGFKVTKWRQSSRISVYNEPVGELAIFYLEERPPADEGPFLKEERVLLDALAERIGTTAMRIYAEQELQEINRQLNVERKALKESNTALRAVLAKIEEEKQQIHRNVRVNVEKVLMPILHALALELPQPRNLSMKMRHRLSGIRL